MNTNKKCKHCANLDRDMICLISKQKIMDANKSVCNGEYYEREHLRRYVDEFTFRLNEGNVGVDTIERMESLGRAFGNKRLTYKELIR